MLSDYTLREQLQITTELLEEERRRKDLVQQKLNAALLVLSEFAAAHGDPYAARRLREITNMGLNGD